MRPLIRNIQGKPRPLIMHRRLSWLRALDRRVRHRVRGMLGLQFHRPRYMVPRRTPEQRTRTLLAVEAYVGTHSPDPRLVRYYDERRRLMRLARPDVSDDVKRQLVAEGPRCSPEDEAHVLSLYDSSGRWAAGSEAQAVLSSIKQSADEVTKRLTEAPSLMAIQTGT